MVGADCDAKELIAEHEGKISYVYDDASVGAKPWGSCPDQSDDGYATIGIGFVLDTRMRPDRDDVLAALDPPATYSDDMTLTDEQIYQLLDANYQTAVSDARKILKDKGGDLDSLCCNVRNALVSMSFNLGYNKLKGFPSMLGAIVAQDWDEAAAQAVDSDWCGQVGKGYHSNGEPKRCTDTELRYKAGCPAADAFSDRPEGAAATEFDERGALDADVVNDPRRRRRSSASPCTIRTRLRPRTSPTCCRRPARASSR